MDGDAAEGNGFGDQIARGAGNGGDNGAIAFDELIEEARLPYIRASDDGKREAFVHDLAKRETFLKLRERRADVGDAGDGLFGGENGNVVFGEVDAGFEDGDEIHELLLDGLDAARDGSAELLGSDFRLVERLRIDEVADGFGLGEIDAPIEEGAHGELAGI